MKRVFGLSLCLLLAAGLGLGLALGPSAGDPAPSGPRTVEGTVEQLIADDFEGGRKETLYHLVTDAGERIPLAFAAAPSSPLRTGMRLRVTGQAPEGEPFAVEAAEILSGASRESASSALTIGAKRVLLVRYNYANDTSQPYSDAVSQSTMFGAAGSVAAFYAEGSYGLTTHTGAITPWLTVSANKPTTCDISAYTQANTLASAAGYNPGSYDYVVYVFPRIPCGWSGLGVVGGSGAWINQALSTYVVSHEMGHNYGLWHSHSWDCGAAAIGPSCVRGEYGDPFDTMGGALRQFNAFSKSDLGWLSGASIATLSSGGATYTLSALESGSGLRALQLPTGASTPTYWVEFRQPIGFDAGLSGNPVSGALIHLGPSAVLGSDLLDMTPGTNTFGDAALTVGKAFRDPATNLTIKVLSKTASTLDVRVDFGPVIPTANFYYAPASPSIGQAVTFTDISSGIPTSWSWSFGDSATSTLQNPSHTYAVAGSYTVTLTASNRLGPSAQATQTVVVAPPPGPVISSFVANPTLPRPAGTTITWTATASGGTAPLQYQFLLYSTTSGWSIPRPYAAGNTWAWTPAQSGQYAVQVWVKSNGSTNAYDTWAGSGYFNITPGAGAPTITSFVASPTVPQQAGTPITWTATATGGTAPLQYQFLLYSASSGWSIPRPYAAGNTWTWTPTVSGQYAVQVWVKNNGSTTAYDAWTGTSMFNIVNAGGPLTITSLAASPALPQRAGTAITWTAMASGGTAPLQYQFLLYSAASGWSIPRPYAAGNTWIWTPAQPGQYAIQVWVRNSGSSAPYDLWAGSGFFNITP